MPTKTQLIEENDSLTRENTKLREQVMQLQAGLIKSEEENLNTSAEAVRLRDELESNRRHLLQEVEDVRIRMQGQIDEIHKAVGVPVRRRMPATRSGLTHKFSIGNHEGYILTGTFEDGTLGEVFIEVQKEGSTIGGMMDTIGIITSMALQYGVPLESMVRKFSHQRYEPSGYTNNPDIPLAYSITDYVFRWLGCTFIPGFLEANRTAPPPAAALETGALTVI